MMPQPAVDSAAADAVRVLLLAPDANGSLTPELRDTDGFAAALTGLLRPACGGAEPVDYLNMLARRPGADHFAKRLAETCFAAFTRAGIRPRGAADAAVANPDRDYLLRHVRQLCTGLRELGHTVPAELLAPAARAMLSALPETTDDANLLDFIATGDPFTGGQAYRWLNGRFEPARLEAIRAVNRFYGFPGVRRIFNDHFAAFARGENCVPLLISSLPGHGKTQLTIAHALAHPELTLILASGETLEKDFEALIEALRLRPDRRFVVFFDDLDPERIDWYPFRTHVGGSFSPPGHVLLTLASNYEFPASILSRGRSVQFPTFDDIRCEEMIEDFLAGCGFRKPNRNLISLIAAGYTEEFGQKRFTELSPRTLIRHLHVYETNRRKRSDMVQLACGPMITKPDPELFYEFNIRLMRKLYGNEYIEQLLKDKLKAME